MKGKNTSKYDKLFDFVKAQSKELLTLTFNEIEAFGTSLVHSFLTCKKDLLAYGFKAEKISMKEKYVVFSKIK